MDGIVGQMLNGSLAVAAAIMKRRRARVTFANWSSVLERDCGW